MLMIVASPRSRIENVMITTGSQGGAAVLDLETGQELWSDPDVREHAHLEHDEGWVVHDIHKRDEEGRTLDFQVGLLPSTPCVPAAHQA